MRIVLLGLVGTGKGTQAQRLSRRLGVSHIASGDLFRSHRDQGTDLGRQVQQYMNRGELVPDAVTIGMVLERMRREDARPGFILDGFPRTVAQAQALDQALSNAPVDCAIHLRVPQEVLVQRLSGRLICRTCQTPYHRDIAPPQQEGRCDGCNGELYQREDDQAEIVELRLEIQEAELEHLAGLYRRQGKLQAVDGDQSVEAVEQALLQALAAQGLQKGLEHPASQR